MTSTIVGYAALVTTKRGVLLRLDAPARHNPDRGMNKFMPTSA
jgi:hypothetical protein